MTAPIELDRADAARLFATWLDEFARAVESQDQDGLAGLFDADASWRDFMAFRWDFSNQLDRESLVPAFLEAASVWQATAFSVNTDQEPLTDGDSIQGFFDFQTRDRVDRGYVHLVRVDSRFVARSMQTQIISLQEFPERTGHNRPEGKVYGLVPNRTRWRSDRTKESAFEDSDPAVLILGAGHNGLAVAARLGALDVPTLVIDKEDRVGDQWRNRYAALALHSSVFGDHLPYLPLPPTWTAHTPKDKWADWLESYAQLLDLNVWTGTEYVGGEYHDDTQRWTIRVRRPDGSIRELHPRHFFVAGGMFGAPKTPDIPGLDTFAGEAMHSDKFQDGASFAGKRALVVGAGVSAHEIAHDLWEHGADVTMLQRSATYVLSYESYHKYWNPLFTEDMPMAPEFADQVGNAVPFVKNIPRFQQLVKDGAETDKELLDGLVSAGFALEWGPDGTGVLGAHQSGRDGYQIDIGASQLVANGSVHLKHGVELSEIRGNSVLFSDGTELEVDVIVFATGYHQFWGHMGPTLGSVASKIESAYSRADDGEYANTWRRSAQPGLWFGAGFIRMARFYSQFSALMIKAIEEGLEPIDPDHPEKRPQ
ncbi:flavin-containing monooxygenase [Herbiconiux ginsengi]|nr:NAD(P)/FAD-dependent oxidoreductase [Herbiconiux ginsengi]